MQDVWILGGYQSDFARNLSREQVDFAGLTREVVDHTLKSARVDAAGIGVVHVANAFGDLFAGQAHLGAMPATVHPDLWAYQVAGAKTFGTLNFGGSTATTVSFVVGGAQQ